MEISFKKIESEPEFETIKKLYLFAFPAEERREYNELIKQLYFDECAVNLIIADEKVAGFCIIWDFSDFVFLEHFAIEPELRGLGIGKKILFLLRENFQKPVILEVEPALDELGLRRINFYLRNGFHQFERNYMQPSYGGDKPEIKMKLMGTKSDYSDTQLDEFVSVIRKKVYPK